MRIPRPISSTAMVISVTFAISGIQGVHLPLQAQAPEEEARIRPAEEVEAVEAWAERRLEELAEESWGAAGPPAVQLERLWALYLLSVEDKDREKEALELLKALSPELDVATPEWRTMEALRGAVEVVRAKHSRWPPNKLKHLRRGLEILDDLVGTHPDALEVRYLRLVSCFYLPFFLKQEDSVKADMAALVSLLPEGSGVLSPPIYEGVVRFVLNHAELTDAERDRLEGVLQ